MFWRFGVRVWLIIGRNRARNSRSGHRAEKHLSANYLYKNVALLFLKLQEANQISECACLAVGFFSFFLSSQVLFFFCLWCLQKVCVCDPRCRKSELCCLAVTSHVI